MKVGSKPTYQPEGVALSLSKRLPCAEQRIYPRSPKTQNGLVDTVFLRPVRDRFSFFSLHPFFHLPNTSSRRAVNLLSHHRTDNGIIFLEIERFTMALQNIDQLLKRAGKLTPSERLLLASRLIQGVRSDLPSQKSRRKWRDAAGLLPYPALGEDAQLYITRTRRADNDRRTRVVRDGK